MLWRGGRGTPFGLITWKADLVEKEPSALAIQTHMDNIFCKGSVDTTIIGVDTMAQSKGRKVKKRSSSVDTSPGQVDTRDLSQGFDLPVWESVSTHLMGRSTHSGISVT
ncbi:hypothetical protein Taro_056977 [Colocasia esculenta]|uniref:Uncharacterized protein n=1 Tax=Colocasia esculenta TaxID=4460 RepID=A0A843XZ04_COLES|nr:hypothetical protein [Colocasia esculenta]